MISLIKYLRRKETGGAKIAGTQRLSICGLETEWKDSVAVLIKSRFYDQPDLRGLEDARVRKRIKLKRLNGPCCIPVSHTPLDQSRHPASPFGYHRSWKYVTGLNDLLRSLHTREIGLSSGLLALRAFKSSDQAIISCYSLFYLFDWILTLPCLYSDCLRQAQLDFVRWRISS